jgi:hypothetical protein
MAKARTKQHRKERSNEKMTPPKKAPTIASRNRTKAVALLKRPGGATLNAIMSATGWQAHSVRGFISGHLAKKMGLKVQSFRRDGERVYALKS